MSLGYETVEGITNANYISLSIFSFKTCFIYGILWTPLLMFPWDFTTNLILCFMCKTVLQPRTSYTLFKYYTNVLLRNEKIVKFLLIFPVFISL